MTGANYGGVYAFYYCPKHNEAANSCDYWRRNNTYPTKQ
jgi:hypothetical protein